ncbi:MAG: GNAT family N-acetyltransferase [Bacteroidetes bacterium]|nr:GNAT family N-acetyltransferase [Bacteroidota bacterium]
MILLIKFCNFRNKTQKAIKMIGKNIYLRALEPEDLEEIYLWENDSELWIHNSSLTPFSQYILKKYIANSSEDIYSSKQLRLIITEKSNDKAIGTIDLYEFNPQHQRAGIGILIYDKEKRKKGYASESLELIIDFCKNRLNLKNLFCNILSENIDSKNLFISNSFKLIGTKKQWVYANKSWHDEELYFLNLK